MDRERFLEEFVYEVEKDFDVNSTPSSWADTELKPAHRYWGDEDHRLELSHPDDSSCRLVTSALTPDRKSIAASNGLAINIYDIATKECRMVFRGLTLPVRSLEFSPVLTETGGYTLMISSSESDRVDSDKSLIFLEVGPDGGRVAQPQLLNIDGILELSMSPVTSQLNGLCGPAVASSLLDTTRAQYRRALASLQATLVPQAIARVLSARPADCCCMSVPATLSKKILLGQDRAQKSSFMTLLKADKSTFWTIKATPSTGLILVPTTEASPL